MAKMLENAEDAQTANNARKYKKIHKMLEITRNCQNLPIMQDIARNVRKCKKEEARNARKCEEVKRIIKRNLREI